MVDTRPIWPGRPELIYQQYLAEKEAWLATHPTIRPANYRKARGLPLYSIKWCKEQHRYLPFQRLNLETETLLEGRPHWTVEEVSAWLDNENIKEQEVERVVEEELISVGGYGQSGERGVEGLWNRIKSESAAENQGYRFTNY